MKYAKHITDLIGNTPLLRSIKFSKKVRYFLAKIESFNPGHSIKDKLENMIEDAEKGLLKEGGTVIESTSGNTGMGLAFCDKGYKMIVTMPDKMSKEKIDILRAGLLK